MADLDLLDIALKNGKYTWSNKRYGIGHVVARLGRYLVSSTFLQKDILPASLALPSAISDHKPISLILSPPINLGVIPFRFNPILLQDETILSLIQEEWNLQYFGSPNYIWESKLRSMRSSLKRWIKEGFKNPNQHKIELQIDLATLQSRMEVDEVTPTFLSQERAGHENIKHCKEG